MKKGEIEMVKKITARITILVEPDFKFLIQAKAFSKRTTPSKVMRTLLEKWLKEK